MTLQTSGAISFSDLQTEFGGSNPISLSEYYAGGAYVPSGTSGTNGAVPASGAISMSQFYGTSNAVVSVAGTYTVYALRVGSSVTATATFSLDSNGKIYKYVNGTQTSLGDWVVPNGQASNFEVYATLDLGTLTSGTTGSWLALSSGRSWTVSRTALGNSAAVFSIQIRRVGTTSPLYYSTITLEADREP